MLHDFNSDDDVTCIGHRFDQLDQDNHWDGLLSPFNLDGLIIK